MKKILIAENDTLIRDLLADALRGEYEILTAKDGCELIKRYKAERPEIIISDIQMPVLSGLEACREIRNVDNNVIICLLTGYQESWMVQDAISIGVNAFILKNREALGDLKYFLNDSEDIYLGKGVAEILAGEKGLRCYNISDREEDVLRLLVEGKTAREIADTLFISPFTVQNHTKSLRSKLKCKNVIQLINKVNDLKSLRTSYLSHNMAH